MFEPVSDICDKFLTIYYTYTIQILSERYLEANFEYLKKNPRFLNKRYFPREFKKMGFAPKTPTAFKISERNFLYVFFKSTKFYLSMSTGWKVTKDRMKALQNFEDFLHHEMNELELTFWYRNLKFCSTSLWSFVTSQLVDLDK